MKLASTIRGSVGWGVGGSIIGGFFVCLFMVLSWTLSKSTLWLWEWGTNCYHLTHYFNKRPYLYDQTTLAAMWLLPHFCCFASLNHVYLFAFTWPFVIKCHCYIGAYRSFSIYLNEINGKRRSSHITDKNTKVR